MGIGIKKHIARLNLEMICIILERQVSTSDWRDHHCCGYLILVLSPALNCTVTVVYVCPILCPLCSKPVSSLWARCCHVYFSCLAHIGHSVAQNSFGQVNPQNTRALKEKEPQDLSIQFFFPSTVHCYFYLKLYKTKCDIFFSFS